MPDDPLPPNSRKARRRAFFEVATQTFLEFGYEATTLDEIIRRAGGSKSTIYANYGGKEGLFTAIAHDLMVSVMESAHRNMPVNGPLRERMKVLARGYINGLCQERVPEVWRLMIANAKSMPETMEGFYANGPEKIVNRIAGFISEANEAGEVQVSDPRRAAQIFLGGLRTYPVIFGPLFAADTQPDPEERDRIVEDALDIFFNGVATRTDRS